ncbi:capsule assembly Wzi family protein [bacterium]|nr:capsule assembly Wzi family protein [bacterium]
MFKRSLFILLLATIMASAAIPATIVPLDHWAYGVADQLIVRGVWPEAQVSERPWTRAVFARAVGSLLMNNERGEQPLNAPAKALLHRLREEFEPEIAAWGGLQSPVMIEVLRDVKEEDDFAIEVGGRLLVNLDYHTARWHHTDGVALPSETDGETPAQPEDGIFHRERGYVLFGAGYGDTIALYGRGEFDTAGKNDSDWMGADWKGDTSAQFDYGFLRWQPTEWFNLSLGREPLQWGYSRGGSLLLSGTAPALDGFRYAFDFGNLHFSYFHAGLDEQEYENDGTGHDGIRNRYLVGHRLAWRIIPELSVGIAEATIYGGEDRTIEWAYLNPLNLHYIDQLSGSTGNDNPYWLIDVDAVPFPGLRLWGQLMIDDFQYEDVEEPPEIGVLLGGSWADPLDIGGVTVSLEYLKVWNWVYNVVRKFDKLLFINHPLGYPRGNDTDRWTIALEYFPNPYLNFGLTATLDRHGEGRILEDWDALDHFGVPSPSGIVENRSDFSLDAEWNASRAMMLGLSVGYELTENRDNVADEDSADFYAGVKGSYLFGWL